MKSTSMSKRNYIVFSLAFFLVFLLSANLFSAAWVEINGGVTGADKSGAFRAIAYGGGKYVAVGDAGLIEYVNSADVADRSKWQKAYPGLSGACNIYAVSYVLNTMFVAVGRYGVILTSTNGASWTIVKPEDTTASSFCAVTSDAETGMIVIGGVGSKYVTYDSNGDKTWKVRTGPFPSSSEMRALAYGNGKFVGVCSSGKAAVSTDGSSWEFIDAVTSECNFYVIVFDGTKFLAGGRKGYCFTSTDGKKWTAKQKYSDAALAGLTYTGDKFVGVGDGNDGCTNIQFCADPSSWKREAVNDYSTLLGISNDTQTVIAAGIRKLLIYNTNAGIVDGKGCGTVQEPYIRVDAPTSGTFVKRGTNYTVRWVSSQVTDDINIRISTNGGEDGYPTKIAAGIPNTGTYTYAVPSDTPIGSNYKIKILAANQAGSPYDYSNGTFSIGDVAPTKSMTVTYPNGGESFAAGSTVTFKWSAPGVSESIRIRLSTNGGADGYPTVLVSGTSNTGSCSVTLPSTTSSNCLVKIFPVNEDGSPFDVSDAPFTIGADPSFSFTSPKAGETVAGGSSYTIRWTGTKKYNTVDLYCNSGQGAKLFAEGVSDTGSYQWTPPNITHVARILLVGHTATATEERLSDLFNLVALSGTINVTAPNGGESWSRNTKQSIKWTTSGTVGSTVKISYSTDSGDTWTEIASSVPTADGNYDWTIPSTVPTSYQCLVKVADAANGALSDTCNNVFIIGGQKEITLSKTRLNFGIVNGGTTACPQDVLIVNGGAGKLAWTATASENWIKLNPASGNGDGYMGVSVDTTGMNTGNYTGTITIADSSAVNSPQTVNVTLAILDSTGDQPPIGDFATPSDGSAGISGSIAVTGWALDDICLDNVKIYRVNGEERALIGQATFVEGARPDVEQAFTNYPNCTKAGWGYMLLTNVLSDGQITLKAYATDNAGHEALLGTKTITVENKYSKKPFGAIDSPTPGGEASGSNYRNQGWALTPQPNSIKADGSTINVYIDGKRANTAKYGVARADIAGLFPGYVNSSGPMAYYDFDTTRFINGVHTISWSVMDSAGNIDGIGSRYFTIMNTASSDVNSVRNDGFGLGKTDLETIHQGIPSTGFIMLKQGMDSKTMLHPVYPDGSGLIQVQMKELDRIEINLDEMSELESNIGIKSSKSSKDSALMRIMKPVNIVRYSGYLLVGDELRMLPAGSDLNSKSGVFTWQAGPGFVGEYDIVFFIDRNGSIEKKQVHVNVTANGPQDER